MKISQQGRNFFRMPAKYMKTSLLRIKLLRMPVTKKNNLTRKLFQWFQFNAPLLELPSSPTPIFFSQKYQATLAHNSLKKNWARLLLIFSDKLTPIVFLLLRMKGKGRVSWGTSSIILSQFLIKLFQGLTMSGMCSSSCQQLITIRWFSWLKSMGKFLIST